MSPDRPSDRPITRVDRRLRDDELQEPLVPEPTGPVPESLEVEPDLAGPDDDSAAIADGSPVVEIDQFDELEGMTDTRVDEGDLEARPAGIDQPDEPASEGLETLVADELRSGETDDPREATEEGLTYVPPMDPPVEPGTRGDPEVRAGFGMTRSDEPFDAEHHAAATSSEDERTQRVVEALAADAATSGLFDRLDIDTEGAVVTVAGGVDDLDDEEAVLAVASSVPGVQEVRNELRVEALE
jgi:hypothetical protein